MNNAKYCSVYVNKLGKYRVTIRAFIKDSLKVIKNVDFISFNRAKNLLEANGVDPQEAEMALLHMEELGLDHGDFGPNGKLIYCDFVGLNH